MGNTASVSVSIGKNTGTGTVLSPLAPLCEHFQASVSVNDVIVSSSPYHGDGYGSLRSDGEGKEEAVLANQCSPRCFVGNRPEERDDYTDIGAGFEGDSRPATQQEQDFCRDFETAWAAFLLDHPEHVPTGPREERIIEMQQQVSEVVESRQTLQLELKQQLHFLHNKLAGLEGLRQQQLLDSAEKQRVLHQDLQLAVDSATMAEDLQQKTAPWFNFWERTDVITESIPVLDTKFMKGKYQNKNKHRSSNAEGGCGLVSMASMLDNISSNGNTCQDNPEASMMTERTESPPSARSMALLAKEKLTESGSTLRAHGVDHALLKTHHDMLKLELARLDLCSKSLPMVGRFLAEHDVLELLKPQQPQQDDRKDQNNYTGDRSIKTETSLAEQIIASAQKKASTSNTI